MRKLLTSLAIVTTAFTMTSCMAGPHQLRRTVDDWDHKMYVNNPWLNGVLWVVPVFPLANYFSTWADTLTGDAWAFWVHDAWDMKGTGFKHADIPATDGQVGSLIGDGSWLKVTK